MYGIKHLPLNFLKLNLLRFNYQDLIVRGRILVPLQFEQPEIELSCIVLFEVEPFQTNCPEFNS